MAKNTSCRYSLFRYVRSSVVVLGDLDLDSPSPPAYAMQNPCDSRSYPTARPPIESSRRAESIAHLFIAQRRFIQ
jgi:hypothetical protein